MRRFENWPLLLADFIEERRDMPLIWGENDCCIFTADWIGIATGVDFAQDFRGTYKNQYGAKRVLAKFAAQTPLNLAESSRLEKIAPMTAQRGDIVAVKTAESHALGICLGAQCAFVGDDGLIFKPLKEAVAAWRV